MATNLHHVAQAVLEYVEGTTGVVYKRSAEPIYETVPRNIDTDIDNYMARLVYESDYYNDLRPLPTSLIFDQLTLEIRAEVSLVDFNQDAEGITFVMEDYKLVTDRSKISSVVLTYRARTLPRKQEWVHTRRFEFRNGFLRSVN